MRLTLVISGLSSGGAERVLSTMANYWAARDWIITVLTWEGQGKRPFYPLDPRVIYRPLGLEVASTNSLHALLNNARRVVALRRAIEITAPQVVISFGDSTNVVSVAAVTGLGVPLIVSERVDPRAGGAPRVWDRLRRWTYPHASRVVVQTQDVLPCFSARVRRRSRIIPNPVSVPPNPCSCAGRVEGSEPTVLSMGRLVPQKGFDMLLDAFAQVALRNPNWKLDIWGEGPSRSALEARARALGLEDRVHLCGRTQQPFDVMRRASLFVLSSRFEGFPNVLCEAMACGLPAVSFDCMSGPRDIIRHGVNGILVPPGDVTGLATVLDRLMTDAKERDLLGCRATGVAERFGLDTVMTKWQEIIREVVQ
ncbi:MAG: glycosyltransferase family 4 protein [Chloroflexi bacterium]|nr:MAG: glycosyltransferase family 4 protein [Chloroflexota bacterium]